MRLSRPTRRLIDFGLVVLVCCGIWSAAAPADEPAVPSSREQITLSFAPLVKRVEPAVVNIYTRAVVQQRTSPLFADPFFRQFFGDAFGQPSPRVQNSLGSGVIVRSDGLVVTNVHVIEGAQEIKVVLSDGREFAATPITTDEQSDLALLKVDPEGAELPTLDLGDSDALEVGDLVLAIGNPFGVGQTVTSGIISALARTRVGITDYGFFIQTDAAINPGNSGGALVTMDGKLAGINTAIVSRTGGSVGIGFAIPANMVRSVIDAAGNGGKIVRPWIGATGQPVTAELAQGFGLAKPGGVVINNLYDGGPAQKAGLKVGDIVTAINDRAVEDPGALKFRLATLPVGSTATLTVLRKGQSLDLAVPLVEAPETPPREETLIEGRTPLMGAHLANLSPALGEEIGISTVWSGVVVTKVDNGSPAAQVGFRPGDILLKINDAPTPDVKTALDQLAQRSVHWKIMVKRGDRVQTLDLG
ncbi:MAG TPA: DegQ family serine endoprotease [Hypericibacter adhaerens]|uniref:Serine protease n=1 Tax=Hypericibacter adhaerens TaxID=2602016 RepID=A0A5J6N002_9PROT|nr:DegQ family serine endoprotease [Hypericibacter adhaerens]QEX21910.1 serine protease [Hypericibacter adhaerens]HWA42269.1 DegQ family serine endoprotease [Hypericibacter adhaerens]